MLIQSRSLARRRWLVAVAMLITMIAVVAPFQPRMPASGLDNAWMFAMNDAIARHLSLGEAVLFPFGPYASLYTRVFHPDLDMRVLLTGILVALQCFICFNRIASARSHILWIAFGIALLFFAYSLDAILVCADLLAGLYAWSLAQAGDASFPRGRSTVGERLSVAFVFAVTGLLTLVKITLIFLGGPMLLLAAGVLIQRRRLDLALIAVVAFGVGIPVFWSVAGQRLDALYPYFLGSIDLMSGYTDAMSTPGDPAEVVSYWIAAVLALIAIARCRSVSRASRWWLAAIVGLVLMTASKSGFVRHDFHATIAAGALVLTVLALRIMIATPLTNIALIAAWCVAFYFDLAYVHSTIESTFLRIAAPYADLWKGIGLRSDDSRELRAEYTRALTSLKAEHPFPLMDGTSDIYSTDQAHLIASGNRWNPRPVFQSYSAYNENLLEINRRHLTDGHAPDHVFVRIEPIDGHPPLSEDGASWPELLLRYSPTALVGDAIRLDRRQTNASMRRVSGTPETHVFGERVPFAESAPIEFISLDIHQTWLGRLISFLFRIDSPRMTLELRDGTTRVYRLFSKGAAAGFIVSPVVENARDVLQLYAPDTLVSKQVKALTLQGPADATRFDRLFWNRRFTMTSSVLMIDEAFDLTRVMPMDRMSDDAPAPDSTMADCLGSIDLINDQHDFSRLTTGVLLRVDGWMDQQSASVPSREVFVTLTDSQGRRRYIATHATPRPDVATYLKRPELENAGYAATADLSAFEGPVTLGMAFLSAGKLVTCRQFAVSIDVRH